LQTEYSKKRLLVLAGGSVLGLLLGGAIVLARNFPFGVFRTSQQVTYATGLSCAVLPEILSADEQASLTNGEYVLHWPFSRFAETLRSIWATINIAQRESGAKVVCVISSNPGEGKTTVAINLALHSTARVLLIDADSQRKSLTNRGARDAREGLKEALGEPTALLLINRSLAGRKRAQPRQGRPLPNRMPRAFFGTRSHGAGRVFGEC
jgi:succinoglycan biosynthesis transport protein ExoP